MRRAKFRVNDDEKRDPLSEMNAVVRNNRDGVPPRADRSRAFVLVDNEPGLQSIVPNRFYAVGAPADGHIPRKRITNARRNKYRDRPRHFSYMGWVKAQPCMMMPYGGCHGVVEADHAGLDRGVGMKAHDNTCVPLCSQHHHDRHNFTGPFRGFDKERMRAWRTTAVELTQETARRSGVEVPT